MLFLLDLEWFQLLYGILFSDYGKKSTTLDHSSGLFKEHRDSWDLLNQATKKEILKMD